MSVHAHFIDGPKNGIILEIPEPVPTYTFAVLGKPALILPVEAFDAAPEIKPDGELVYERHSEIVRGHCFYVLRS